MNEADVLEMSLQAQGLVEDLSVSPQLARRVPYQVSESSAPRGVSLLGSRRMQRSRRRPAAVRVRLTPQLVAARLVAAQG